MGGNFGPDWNISTNIGWIVMEFCTGMYGLQRMNPIDLSDLHTVPSLPSQYLHLWFWVRVDGLPWNLVRTVMSPSLYCNNFGDPLMLNDCYLIHNFENTLKCSDNSIRIGYQMLYFYRIMLMYEVPMHVKSTDAKCQTWEHTWVRMLGSGTLPRRQQSSAEPPGLARKQKRCKVPQSREAGHGAPTASQR